MTDIEELYNDLAELVAERSVRARYLDALDADIARLVAQTEPSDTTEAD
jgi:hypothetical protein